MKLKDHHWELGQHFSRFVDLYTYPNFTLDKKSLSVFIGVESNGRKAYTEEELRLSEPLLDAKVKRGLTEKMIVEECAELWSSGFGWSSAISHVIRTEFWHHGNLKKDKIYLRCLVKMMRGMYKKGFMQYLIDYPKSGMSDSEKDRYIQRFIGGMDAMRANAASVIGNDFRSRVVNKIHKSTLQFSDEHIS